MTTNGSAPQMVNLTIDDRPVSVPKGYNIIKAAASIGIEIPHYCYHQHLSVPGNCRMCQVKVEGQPKLVVACHMPAQDGMKVYTHHVSKEVQDAQAAILEFILINHPLDCTVCDQAGHCKLQDYHFEYNARPSRFVEEKVHKVKAEPLGPTVMLDGERCIMCTRCIRFCDEITKTNELGLLNRGDRNVIAVNPGKVLDNPLSGTVVDLCPVGALTHKKWRFNTRIWFTNETASVCTGCSTGCNVRVAVRDQQVVQVKARVNDQVNKEWLCDEGRYGFMRFLPETRIVSGFLDHVQAPIEKIVAEAQKLKNEACLVLVSPDLTVEEYFILQKLLEKFPKDSSVAVAYRRRQLSEVESILISPDYACNYKGAEFVGLISGDLEQGYNQALADLATGKFKNVFLVGERSILEANRTDTLVAALAKAPLSVGILHDARSKLFPALKCVLPGRSILEKSGLLLNGKSRLQYATRLVDAPAGAEPEWRLLNLLADKLGAKITAAGDDRALTIEYLGKESRLAGLRISDIKGLGVDLNQARGSQTHSAAVENRA